MGVLSRHLDCVDSTYLENTKKHILRKIIVFVSIFSVLAQSLSPYASLVSQRAYAQEITPADPTPTVEQTQPTDTVTPSPTIEQVIPTDTLTPTPTDIPTEEITPTPTEEVIPTDTQPVDNLSPPTDNPSATLTTPSEWTFENVELDKEYVAPQNSGVKLTFTKLPSPAGNIKIEEITLTEDQIKQTGSLSDKAYDITSDMKDGDFSYNLSLPIPESSKGKAVEVKFAEELSNIGTAEKVENTLTKTDTSVSVTNLNHMTIFVVVNPSPPPTNQIGNIFDNDDGSSVYLETGAGWGNITDSTCSTNSVNANARRLPNTSSGTATFTFDVPTTGNYKVYAIWTYNTGRATNATYTVNYEGGPSGAITKDQRTGAVCNSSDYQPLGTYLFNSGISYSVVLSNAGADGAVVADAIKILSADDPTIVYVDDNWSGASMGSPVSVDSNTYYIGFNAFSKIQDAIAGVASDGTINVAAGTYNETVSINKPLTLKGAQAGVDAGGRSASESIVSATGIEGTLVIGPAAGTVTIDGFKISGTPTPGSGGVIYVSGLTTNVIVNNNIIEPSTADGILFYNAVSGTAEQNWIKGAALSGITGGRDTAMKSALTIQNNRIDGAFYGISGYLDASTISGNTINGTPDANAAGIGGQFYNTTITNNSVSGYTNGAGLAYVDNLSRGMDTINATGNTFSGNGAGVYVAYDVTGKNITVNGNSITGNSSGGAINIAGVGILDATNNWWGNVSGPYDNKTLPGTPDYNNPSGTGNAVSSNVDYKPWYKDAAMTILSNTAPAVPTLVSPTNGAFVQPAGLILDWSDVTDPSTPITYYYKSSYSSSFGSNNALTSPIYTSGALTASQINASGSSDHLYYWQVRACDGLNNCSDWSGPWSVTIDGTAPGTAGTPSTTSPTNSPTQTWTWTAATDTLSGIASYAWRVTGGPSGSVLGTSTSVITNLLEGVWNFFVKAIDNAGNQGSESTGSVTVDTTAPTVPANGTPHNTTINTNNFDFNWDDSTDNSPITYKYQASQNPTNSGGVLTNGLWTSGTLPTSMIHSSGAGDGAWYWQVKAIDAAANESAWSPIWNVTIDTIAPTITSVTTTTANGAYTIGQVIDFEVSFNEVVNVSGGTPEFSLSAGPPSKAIYVSGSGTSTLTFNYTVAAGHGTPTYLSHNNGSINLNGGTIKDVSSNNANVALPSNTTFLAAHSIVIDTTAPTGSISSPPDGSLLKGTVTVNANASDGSGSGINKVEFYHNISPITLFGTDTTAPYLANWSTTATDDGSHVLYIRIYDLAGNVSSDIAGPTITIDNTAPTVASVDSDGKTFNIADMPTETIKVTFSEDIANTPTIDVNPPAQNQTVNSCSDADAKTFCFDYTIQANQEILHTIFVTNAQDAAGNAMDENHDHRFNVDTIAPTLSQVTPVTTPTSDTTPSYTFSSTEGGGVTYSGDCVSAYAAANSGNNTLTFNGLPDGVHSNCTITVIDGAGNASAPLNVSSFRVDTVAPATPSATPEAGDYTSAGVSVTLSSSDTGGSGVLSIYYTLDGTDPSNSNGTEYTGLIFIGVDTTLKAIAYDNVGNASGIMEETYGIPPIISGEVFTRASDTSLTVGWLTDDPATSRVIYGTSSVSDATVATFLNGSNYGYANSTVEDSTKVTSHSVSITGLLTNVTYYYRVISHGSPESVGAEQTYTIHYIFGLGGGDGMSDGKSDGKSDGGSSGGGGALAGGGVLGLATGPFYESVLGAQFEPETQLDSSSEEVLGSESANPTSEPTLTDGQSSTANSANSLFGYNTIMLLVSVFVSGLLYYLYRRFRKK